MYMNPNAPNRGLRKIQKIVKNCTFLDFLTPKCVQYPPKRGAHTCPSSMTEHAKSDCQKVQIEAGGGLWKIDKMTIFFQKSTFLDFLTTKCAPDLPKCLVFQNPSSLARAREIGLSKGSN